MIAKRPAENDVGLATLCLLVLGVVLGYSGAGGTLGRHLFSDVRNRFPNKVQEDIEIVNYYQQIDKGMYLDPGIPKWMSEQGKRVAMLFGREGKGLAAQHDEGRAAAYLVQFPETPAVERSNDFLGYRLRPMAEVQHMGVRVITNEFGMRDDRRRYTLAKPPGTFRIALLGASNTMGVGVEHEYIFENLLEERLNQELAGRGAYRKYEVLNFAVWGYFIHKRLYVLTEQVARFQPDLVLLTTNMHDVRRLYMEVADAVEKRTDLHFDFIKRIVDRSDIAPNDSLFVKRRKLEPFKTALVDGCYEYVKRWSDENRIPVAVVVLRLKTDPRIHDELLLLLSRAEAHGLLALPVFKAYQGQDPGRMYIAGIHDSHPTRYAHALLADNLFEQLVGQPPPLRRLLEGTPTTND